jgi:hypothetical protein
VRRQTLRRRAHNDCLTLRTGSGCKRQITRSQALEIAPDAWICFILSDRGKMRSFRSIVSFVAHARCSRAFGDRTTPARLLLFRAGGGPGRRYFARPGFHGDGTLTHLLDKL